MNKVRQEELKVEIDKEKRQIKRLYIEADEDHVSERKNKYKINEGKAIKNLDLLEKVVYENGRQAISTELIIKQAFKKRYIMTRTFAVIFPKIL